jgi:hypothetical protein
MSRFALLFGSFFIATHAFAGGPAQVTSGLGYITDDVLDPPAIAAQFPYLIKRTERRDANQALSCGVVVRCSLPNEVDCHVQLLSAKDGGVYSVIFSPGHSSVKRGNDGSLSVSGPMVDDVRAPQAGMPAPLMSFVWLVTGNLTFNSKSHLFDYVQKQSAIGVTATLYHQDVEAQGFKLPDIAHCSEMLEIAP